jgi:aspartyl/asparaginyl beta-hydroxylase (cupin superfamily)
MNPGANTDGFVQRAQQAMAAGRHDEAARMWEQVLASSPDDPQALLHLGQLALQRKDIAAARGFLQRAAKASPQNPVIALNLAFAARMTSDAKAELAALTQALTIDPYFYPALLARGALLERVGQRRQAAQNYKNVLATLPPPDQIPKELQGAIAHARESVDANARALDRHLQPRLASLRAKHAAVKLDRFEECKDIMLGIRKAYAIRPTLLHFPRLPAIQFYENGDFPCLAAFEAQTDTIRRELLDLLEAQKTEFKPYINHAEGTPAARSELNNSPRWSAFFLWKDGKKIEDHCTACPRTAELLEQAGMADVPGYAPTAFFSVLEPHTPIAPHVGVTNTRLVAHIPLIIPEKCGFRVGNETREWQPGTGWIFDDTIEHEAWNNSDQVRVILIFDVWNPYLSAAEREFVCELLSSVDDYYRSE